MKVTKIIFWLSNTIFRYRPVSFQDPNDWMIWMTTNVAFIYFLIGSHFIRHMFLSHELLWIILTNEVCQKLCFFIKILTFPVKWSRKWYQIYVKFCRKTFSERSSPDYQEILRYKRFHFENFWKTRCTFDNWMMTLQSNWI